MSKENRNPMSQKKEEPQAPESQDDNVVKLELNNQDIVDSLKAQRNEAYDKIAMMQAQHATMQRKIIELNEELKALKK